MHDMVLLFEMQRCASENTEVVGQPPLSSCADTTSLDASLRLADNEDVVELIICY
jgi:hypothetical protein